MPPWNTLLIIHFQEESVSKMNMKISAVPGKKTLLNFLMTALLPAGKVLYIYGGGWNREDTGAGMETRSLGLQKSWEDFFGSRTESFSYRGFPEKAAGDEPAVSYYPFNGINVYHDAGLDCSGYLGWVLYNTFETENGKDGYVLKSSDYAKELALRGWGTRTPEIAGNGNMPNPGDIVSIKGHVYISLGSCADESILIAHSTPSESRQGMPGGGVQVSAIGRDRSCIACQAADRYMSAAAPEWYRRYPAALCDPARYLTAEGSCGRFIWRTGGDTAVLTDPENVQGLPAEELLDFLVFAGQTGRIA